MSSILEFKWEQGDVGDHWLSVGRCTKVVHIYQTPWTGKNWWIDGEMFGFEKGYTCDNMWGAMVEAEHAVERWIARSVYTTPDVDEVAAIGAGDLFI